MPERGVGRTPESGTARAAARSAVRAVALARSRRGAPLFLRLLAPTIPRMSDLLMQRTGWRCDLTMNRPDRLNAVTEEMYEGLVKELAAASDDPTVRVVVLRGAGRAFCVGADLKDHGVAERSEDDKRRYAQFGQDAAAAIMDCSKPVVAAVHGHAIGAEDSGFIGLVGWFQRD